jgi:hypothetical protein
MTSRQGVVLYHTVQKLVYIILFMTFRIFEEGTMDRITRTPVNSNHERSYSLRHRSNGGLIIQEGNTIRLVCATSKR